MGSGGVGLHLLEWPLDDSVAYPDNGVRSVTGTFSLAEEQSEQNDKHSNKITGLGNTDMCCTKALPFASGILTNLIATM